MLYSNTRKLTLSGWLQENNASAYRSPLKLQKFLFLYEAMSKVAGEKPDFGHLRGYKRGPVFSNVWGDYTKEKTEFNRMASQSYKEHGSTINPQRASVSSFIVSTLSEDELSEFTHKMNIWKSQELRIMSGEQQVDLNSRDFSDDDTELIERLVRIYPIELVENSEVYNFGNKSFVLSKMDATKLSEQHMDVLSVLASKDDLYNPVFVEIDEEGRLLID